MALPAQDRGRNARYRAPPPHRSNVPYSGIRLLPGVFDGKTLNSHCAVASTTHAIDPPSHSPLCAGYPGGGAQQTQTTLQRTGD